MIPIVYKHISRILPAIQKVVLTNTLASPVSQASEAELVLMHVVDLSRSLFTRGLAAA